MKNVLVVSAIFFLFLHSVAQEIEGQWNGVLKLPGGQLRVVFNIEKTADGYSATMDSPDQNAYGLKATSADFNDGVLLIKLTELMIEYSGNYAGDSIKGSFKQGGMSFQLDLSRNVIGKAIYKRPQEPVEPYPYHAEEIVFINKTDQIRLAGTLTCPEGDGPFPAVVLISGSGPQNRDEEIMGHRPFLVIADHLTRNGISVLRFDDRGTAQSEGVFVTATSVDFSRDAGAAVEYLKTLGKINHKQIGLIGHSEGGIIAPMLASRSADVAFIVLLAGSGIPGDELLVLQNQLIGKAHGLTDEYLKHADLLNKGAFAILKESSDPVFLAESLDAYFRKNIGNLPESQRPDGDGLDKYIASMVGQLVNPWMQFFINHHPATDLEKVKCPVLAINGELDLQVPPKENLAAIENALRKGGNLQFTTLVMPGLNHLFQECQTGLPAEYARIEQTFSPEALNKITLWIKENIK